MKWNSKKFLTMISIVITIFIGIFIKVIPALYGLPAIVTISGYYLKINKDMHKIYKDK